NAARVFGGLRDRHLRAGVRLLHAIKGRFRGGAVAIIVLLGALLAVLSAVVSTGALRGLDVAALDAARSVATSGLDLVASLVGIFGAAEVTLLIALLVGLYRLRRGLRYATLPLLVIATIAIEAALKLTVPQPLPPGGHTVQ